MMSKPVNWPAFIKFEGECELAYITDQTEWETDADLSFFEYEEADILIDSSGQVFSLDKRDSELVEPIFLGKKLSCVEVAELLKKHFSSLGECCVSKFSLSSIEDCMSILGQRPES